MPGNYVVHPQSKRGRFEESSSSDGESESTGSDSDEESDLETQASRLRENIASPDVIKSLAEIERGVPAAKRCELCAFWLASASQAPLLWIVRFLLIPLIITQYADEIACPYPASPNDGRMQTTCVLLDNISIVNESVRFTPDWHRWTPLKWPLYSPAVCNRSADNGHARISMICHGCFLALVFFFF